MLFICGIWLFLLWGENKLESILSDSDSYLNFGFKFFFFGIWSVAVSKDSGERVRWMTCNKDMNLKSTKPWGQTTEILGVTSSKEVVSSSQQRLNFQRRKSTPASRDIQLLQNSNLCEAGFNLQQLLKNLVKIIFKKLFRDSLWQSLRRGQPLFCPQLRVWAL